jgi:ATP-binding cassette, subfamily B, bacterial
MAAVSTLAFPVALKVLIDQGLVANRPRRTLMALRGHFLALFGVAAALGAFSAARFYMVSWLGERITADLRNAVYATCCARARNSSRAPRPARCCRA